MSQNPREKFQNIRIELRDTHRERDELIDATLVALVARQHILQLGKPGSGKTYLTDDIMSRLTDGKTFSTELHEDSKADFLVGAPDIPRLVEKGEARHVIENMLPEALLARIGEVGNANSPILHNLHSIMNEREFHDGPVVIATPTWTIFFDTNHLFSDPTVQAVWDRIHLRKVVDYVQKRENLRDIIIGTMNRKKVDENGHAVDANPNKTTFSKADLITAHNEALSLPIPEQTWETFFDLHEELQSAGIITSTRHLGEGMISAAANAWLRGHDEVRIGDLDVLVHSLWNTLEDIDPVRELVYAETNPSEKEALEHFETLEQLQKDYAQIEDQNLDEVKRNKQGLATYKDCKRLLADMKPLREKANAAGSSTARLDDVIERTERLMEEISVNVFGIDGQQASNMYAAAGA